MADFREELSLDATILSSEIVVNGGIARWWIRCILNVYILIHFLKLGRISGFGGL